MVGAQEYKGAVTEVHDTTGAIMSLRVTQGAASGAHVTHGGAIASERWTYGRNSSDNCVLGIVFKRSEACILVGNSCGSG